MERTPIEAMVEMLSLLEQENHRLKWFGGLTVIGAAVLMLAGANQAANPSSVEADSLAFRD